MQSIWETQNGIEIIISWSSGSQGIDQNNILHVLISNSTNCLAHKNSNAI